MAIPYGAVTFPRSARLPVAAVAAGLVGACATPNLVTDGTRLQRIDDQAAAGGSKFRIDPGLHALVVYLDDVAAAGDAAGHRRFSGEPLAVCFDAQAGHAYRVAPRYDGRSWLPVVADAATGQPVASRVSGGEHPSC